MNRNAVPLDLSYLLREREWRTRRRRRLIMSLLAFVAVVFTFFVMIVRVVADEVSRTETQAECFLKKRLGGRGRLERQRGQRRWVQKLQGLVDDAVRGTSWTPGTVLAISFHESSWRPRALGSRGEHGLMQIHPDRLRVAGLGPGENSLDPATNLRLGVRTLDACRSLCEQSEQGANDPAEGGMTPLALTRVVTCYAAGACSSGSEEVRAVVRIMVRWIAEADSCGGSS